MECKGLIFKIRTNQYFKKYEYVEKPDIHRLYMDLNLTLYRRKSCAECEECKAILKEMESINIFSKIVFNHKPEHGELYKLEKVNNKFCFEYFDGE